MEALFIIVGLILGGAVGVYIGLTRGRRQADEQSARLAGESAALQATLAELRGQLSGRDAELTAAREALQAEKVAGAEGRTRLEAAREHFAEQRQQIQEMDKKLKESFQALSATALRQNNEQFVTLAEAKMKPLREQLQRYEKQISELEQTRAKAYGGLDKQLQRMEESREQLAQETRQLANALRQPRCQGQVGRGQPAPRGRTLRHVSLLRLQ